MEVENKLLNKYKSGLNYKKATPPNYMTSLHFGQLEMSLPKSNIYILYQVHFLNLLVVCTSKNRSVLECEPMLYVRIPQWAHLSRIILLVSRVKGKRAWTNINVYWGRGDVMLVSTNRPVSIVESAIQEHRCNIKF